MKRDTRCVVLLVICVLGLALSAGGQTVKIKTYDVKSAMRSGYGCWSHVYFGTITDVGRTSSLWGTCTPEGTNIADYWGGSGTLNDYIFSSTIADNQLFSIEQTADDASAVSQFPSLTPIFLTAFTRRMAAARSGRRSPHSAAS